MTIHDNIEPLDAKERAVKLLDLLIESHKSELSKMTAQLCSLSLALGELQATAIDTGEPGYSERVDAIVDLLEKKHGFKQSIEYNL